MTREQCKLEIRNFLPQIKRNQEDDFLNQLTGLFQDPEGWLEFMDSREFRRIMRKYYYKEYQYKR